MTLCGVRDAIIDSTINKINVSESLFHIKNVRFDQCLVTTVDRFEWFEVLSDPPQSDTAFYRKTERIRTRINCISLNFIEKWRRYLFLKVQASLFSHCFDFECKTKYYVIHLKCSWLFFGVQRKISVNSFVFYISNLFHRYTNRSIILLKH